MAVFATLPDDVDKELLIYTAFHMGEGFMNTIRQAVTSSTLMFNFALKEFSVIAQSGVWTSPITVSW